MATQCAGCGKAMSEQDRFCSACGVPAAGSAAGSAPVTTKRYVGLLLVLLVPIWNVLAPLIWVLGEKTDPNTRNFARAALIVFALLVVTAIVLHYAIGVDLACPCGSVEGELR